MTDNSDKKDPYNNERRWESWKENHFDKCPKEVDKNNWKVFIEFLKDMELGLNTPKGLKGKRDVGTLLNLSSHNLLFLTNLKKPLKKLTKMDLHNLENEIYQGKILKRNGQKFTAFGNYIKDFKVFWNWAMRTKRVEENIMEDLSAKTDKPDWVFLNEEQIKLFFNKLDADYRVYCWFLYDTGMRVTEAINIRVKDFNEDFSQVTIQDETAKTFGRTINLKLCTQLVKEYVKENKFKPEDTLIQKQPFAINKYLRYHCLKNFGDKQSNPKSKGNYKNFTMYDIRHNAACYWFNRYPTAKGLMYRFGWRKADKIEYYSGFLGAADEIKDSDMIVGEDKTKLYKLEKKVEDQQLLIEELLEASKEAIALGKESTAYLKQIHQKYPDFRLKKIS